LCGREEAAYWGTGALAISALVYWRPS